jgi:hypothetical protein
MSLDVYLKSEFPTQVICTCSCCGNEHTTEEYTFYFDANITHNLNVMADKVGIYEMLWHPKIKYARELIDPLKAGLAKLKANPQYYRRFEPENKWGTYDDFVPWLERYIEACEQYPDAVVSAHT